MLMKLELYRISWFIKILGVFLFVYLYEFRNIIKIFYRVIRDVFYFRDIRKFYYIY